MSSSSTQLLNIIEVVAPSVEFKKPVARNVNRFVTTESWLAVIISLYDINHHSEAPDTLEAVEAYTDEYGVKQARRPKTSSVYLTRGFLLFNDTGSVYYKNNNQTINLGYVDQTGTFIENTENSYVLEAIQSGNYDFLKKPIENSNTEI